MKKIPHYVRNDGKLQGRVAETTAAPKKPPLFPPFHQNVSRHSEWNIVE